MCTYFFHSLSIIDRHKDTENKLEIILCTQVYTVCLTVHIIKILSPAMQIFHTHLQVMAYIPKHISDQILTFFILGFIKVSIAIFRKQA